MASDEEERASEDESETDEAKSQMGRRKSLVEEGMKENEKEQEEMHESASGDEQKCVLLHKPQI